MNKELDRELSLREIVNKETGEIMHVVMAIGEPSRSGKQYKYFVLFYDQNKDIVTFRHFNKTPLRRNFYWHDRSLGYASNLLKRVSRIAIKHVFDKKESIPYNGIYYITEYYTDKFQELLDEFR